MSRYEWVFLSLMPYLKNLFALTEALDPDSEESISVLEEKLEEDFIVFFTS